MYRPFFLLLLGATFLLTSCQEAASTHSQVSENPPRLVHIVLLKLKPDLNAADRTSLILQLKSLAQIEQVNDLQVGAFQELGDARALSEYDMAMEMTFASIEDYRAYQEHPDHIALRTNITPYLSGPPATYDYITD